MVKVKNLYAERYTWDPELKIHKKRRRDGYYRTYNEQTGLYGILGKDGKSEILPPEYQEIENFNKDGIAKILDKDGYAGLVNKKFEFIKVCVYKPITDFDADKGLLWVHHKQTGMCGVVDENFHTVFPFQYKDVELFNKEKGFFKVSVCNDEGQELYGVIDKDCKEVVPYKYKCIKELGFGYDCYRMFGSGDPYSSDKFYEDFYYGDYENNFWGLMSKNGEIIVSCDRGYTDIIPIENNILRVCKGGLVSSWDDTRMVQYYGLMDVTTGEEVVPCEYSYIEIGSRYHKYISSREDIENKDKENTNRKAIKDIVKSVEPNQINKELTRDN